WSVACAPPRGGEGWWGGADGAVMLRGPRPAVLRGPPYGECSPWAGRHDRRTLAPTSGSAEVSARGAVVAGFHGGDTEQMRQHSVACTQGAQRLEDLGSRAQSAIDGASWEGPDADAFRE